MMRSILYSAALLAVGLMAAPQATAKDAVRCANLIYGGTRTSVCFSDAFLRTVQRETGIATERRFTAVKLDSDELFEYPFVVMTGEADFRFTQKERENMAKYLASGGFLLASAGCSSREWDTAFRREMAKVLEDQALTEIPQDHPIFQTVQAIDSLKLKGGGAATLLGVERDGKVVVVYSQEGLNDTANQEGCCCCGGNEIRNSQAMNVNILVYALLH